MQIRKDIRNIAIIAHVDHGKTTLVDAMLSQSVLSGSNNQLEDRVMDSMDLERERGITIAAKNCSANFQGTKINILDTPGHADFGGEVERALQMVDGAILLVDSSEGPLPQTRFVLKKALKRGLKIIVVINKIDRADERAEEVLNDIYDLFIDVDADEEQVEFPVLYAVGRDGKASFSKEDLGDSLEPLFKSIVDEIPGPSYYETLPFQMLVTNLSYSDYLGRLAIGKVHNGSVKKGDSLVCIGANGQPKPMRVSKLQIYKGLALDEVNEINAGEIAILSGVDNVTIGDTICNLEKPVPMDRIKVDEPTITMCFSVNNSPFSGQEGKFVQSTKIAERLEKECLYNVALKVIEGDGDKFYVQGRGEFQMAILIETMRREGFELTVGRPEIIFKKDGGATLEPIEHLFVDCDEESVGIVTEGLSHRKGRMLNMNNTGSGRVQIEFSIPSRGLIGYRNQFLTDTRGTGIMNAILLDYEEHRGEITSRLSGSLVSDRQGESVPFALFNLEPRGRMFIGSGVKVYEGMIIGECNREGDLNVNPCKTKKLSNVRASGKDDAVVLTPAVKMNLEKAIEFIKDDELLEVTPESIRLRKAILPANKR